MMFRKSLAMSLAFGLVAASAMAAVTPNTPTPMPKVKSQMKAVVDKTSTALFNAASEADPENGPDQKLPNAAGWTKIKSDADKLKAVAVSLQNPKVGKTSEANWKKYAMEFGDLSTAASKAAAAKDPKALAKAANDMSDNCAACHKIYKKQT
jgi:cytochrome c556